jgi:hypothetical protein
LLQLGGNGSGAGEDQPLLLGGPADSQQGGGAAGVRCVVSGVPLRVCVRA